jgi:hypothetical protein
MGPLLLSVDVLANICPARTFVISVASVATNLRSLGSYLVVISTVYRVPFPQVSIRLWDLVNHSSIPTQMSGKYVELFLHDVILTLA